MNADWGRAQPKETYHEGTEENDLSFAKATNDNAMITVQ
jgi:hypothetical protein